MSYLDWDLRGVGEDSCCAACAVLLTFNPNVLCFTVSMLLVYVNVSPQLATTGAGISGRIPAPALEHCCALDGSTEDDDIPGTRCSSSNSNSKTSITPTVAGVVDAEGSHRSSCSCLRTFVSRYVLYCAWKSVADDSMHIPNAQTSTTRGPARSITAESCADLLRLGVGIVARVSHPYLRAKLT